jgi:hypothetical protein
MAKCRRTGGGKLLARKKECAAAWPATQGRAASDDNADALPTAPADTLETRLGRTTEQVVPLQSDVPWCE